MKGYSRMRLANKKTRSMDFSDLLFSTSTQETKGNTSPKSPKHTACEAPKVEAVGKNTNHHHDSPPKVEEEDEDANRRSTAVGAHVKLSRTCSVAPTTSSPGFRLERQSSRRTTGVQSTVKRVFSMRRSSSVSERYCRIYDQHVALELAFDDDDVDAEGTDNNAMKTRSMTNKKKSGILKACRRFLGF